MPKKIEDDIEALRKRIIDSALALAISQGWQYTTLRDIALHANVSVAQLYVCVDDKDDVLVLLGREIDRQMFSVITLSGEDDLSIRDRLFDILMERFDILNEQREGIIALLDAFKCDPKAVVVSMPHLCKSMSRILEAAGAETSGVKGAMKVAGLTGVYIKALKEWAKDESEDLSQTMAALDKALENAEKYADMFGF